MKLESLKPREQHELREIVPSRLFFQDLSSGVRFAVDAWERFSRIYAASGEAGLWAERQALADAAERCAEEVTGLHSRLTALRNQYSESAQMGREECYEESTRELFRRDADGAHVQAQSVQRKAIEATDLYERRVSQVRIIDAMLSETEKPTGFNAFMARLRRFIPDLPDGFTVGSDGRITVPVHMTDTEFGLILHLMRFGDTPRKKVAWAQKHFVLPEIEKPSGIIRDETARWNQIANYLSKAISEPEYRKEELRPIAETFDAIL